ncbi:hypothetical protein Dimus_024940 [Dionaea muscipula]
MLQYSCSSFSVDTCDYGSCLDKHIECLWFRNRVTLSKQCRRVMRHLGSVFRIMASPTVLNVTETLRDSPLSLSIQLASIKEVVRQNQDQIEDPVQT